MGKPAARMGDTTAHGGTIILGLPTVLIGKMPAAAMGDMHVCPMCNPGPVPHVGGPIMLGSTGVLIGKKPAARLSDMAICVGPPSMPAMGCMTVLLGEAGSGSQAGSAGSAAAALAAKKKGPKAIEPFPLTKPPEKPTPPHAILCAFVDSAGKPLAGVPYRVKDPDGKDIIGVSTSEGKATYNGYAKAGSYSLSVMSLTDVKWSKAKAGIKDKIKYSAKVEGFEDGEDAFVTLFEEAGALRRMLEFLPAKVSGGKVEGEWQWKKSYEVSDQDKTQISSPVYVFQVVVGFISARSKALVIEDTLKVKVTDPAGKAVQGWNYELTLPNGQMAVGKVDDAGLVKHEHVPPGKHHLKLIDPKRDEKKAAKEKAAKVEKAKPNSAGMGGDKEADNNPEAGAPANKKKNESIIHVGIFFDGTNNNRDRDRPLKHDTNVSKLFDLYKQDNETHFKYYFEGVGTGNWSKSDPVSGRFSGRGVADRIQRAEKSLKEVTEKHPESEIRLSVFGFSRGGGTALAFVNHLYDGNKPIQPMRFNDRMAYNPKKSSTTIAPQDEKTLKRLQFEKVWFMGLFDTVASIGVPGDDDEVTHDISAKQSRIRKLTHFVARDERRGLFPCSSIHQGPGSNLPSGWEERTFPGAHSDVGGGYEVELEKMNPSPNDHGQDHLSVAVYSKKGDHLSRVAGWAMYDAALESYVPMYPIREMQPNAGAAQKSFDNIMKGGKLNETPENGWVTFSLTEGMAKIPKGLVEAISLLSIPFPLIPLWKSRKSELSFKSLIDVHHPDFKDNIYSNSHESLGLMDPKGIGSTVGINPSPRTILYRGAL